MILSFIFKGVEDLQLCFLLKIAVAFTGPLHFQVNFRIRLSISSKKSAKIVVMMV